MQTPLTNVDRPRASFSQRFTVECWWYVHHWGPTHREPSLLLDTLLQSWKINIYGTQLELWILKGWSAEKGGKADSILAISLLGTTVPYHSVEMSWILGLTEVRCMSKWPQEQGQGQKHQLISLYFSLLKISLHSSKHNQSLYQYFSRCRVGLFVCHRIESWNPCTLLKSLC